MSNGAKHSPQVGFNSNVRYRGSIFHIQTEDSGRERPRITTLLFADGGHIIASQRSEYQHLLGTSDFSVKLKQQMQEQHRAVLRELASGALDDKVEAVVGPLAPRSSGREVAGGGDLMMGKGSLVDPLLSVMGERPAFERSTSSSAHPHAPEPPSSKSDANLGSAFRGPVPASGPVYPVPGEDEDPRRRVPELPRRISGRPQANSPDGKPHRGTRPAANFEPSSSSLFGGPLTEGSLNDVILSFIAQELDETPKKG